MATGEAAGTACAISIREGVNARDVDIGMLQQALVKNGVYSIRSPLLRSKNTMFTPSVNSSSTKTEN